MNRHAAPRSAGHLLANANHPRRILSQDEMHGMRSVIRAQDGGRMPSPQPLPSSRERGWGPEFNLLLRNWCRLANASISRGRQSWQGGGEEPGVKEVIELLAADLFGKSKEVLRG